MRPPEPPPPAQTHVVAVVVTTNERSWLDTCLRTLLGSRVGPDVLLEVILVDNGSIDGSRQLVAVSFPEVAVIPAGRNLGFAGANNLGMAEAIRRGADHVLLFNPDTRTPPDLVQGLVDFLQRWPRYGIVGPLQEEYGDEGGPNAWSREALAAGEAHVFANDGVTRSSAAGPAEGRAPGTLEHAYVQGSALACRTAVLRDVGLFDPAYHTYYEETDLCRRARWAGWRVAVVLDLRIQHHGGGSSRDSVYRRRHMQRNKYYYLFTDPEWGPVETARLALRWVGKDLTRRNAIPAGTFAGAVGDTVTGLVWLSTQLPGMRERRRTHARLCHPASSDRHPAPAAPR